MKTLLLLLTMLTTSVDGFFVTEASSEALASVSACSATVDSFISYVQLNPRNLSTWPFAGCGHQTDQSKDAVFLVWKSSDYDAEQQLSHLKVDVQVEGRTMFHDVCISSRVKDSIVDGTRDIRVDIFYSGSLLREAWGEFHIVPVDEQHTRMSIKTHVKFGWFFRIFISKKVYSNTVDWRIYRMMQNFALYAAGIIPDDVYWQSHNSQP